MAVGHYRVRTGTEIIDTAFQLVKSNYAPLLTISAIGFMPTMLAQIAMGGNLTNLVMHPVLPGTLFCIGLVTAVLMQGALVRAIADVYHGDAIDIGRALRTGGRCWGRLAVANLMAIILIGVAMMLFIIPGLIVLAWFFVVPVVIVLEDQPVMESLSRSRELCREHKRRVFGYFSVFGIASVIVGIVFGVIALVLKSSWLMSAVNMAGTIVIWPLYPAFMVLHYYDTRIRQEGYDVELMAQAMGAPTVIEPATT